MTVWFVNRQLGFVWRDEQKEQPVLGEGEGSMTASSELPGTLGEGIWTGLNLLLSFAILCLFSVSPSPLRCPSSPLYSDNRVYALLTA